MAIITLNQSWLQSAGGDASTIITCYSSDRSESRTTNGEVRTYAGGRQRSIALEGKRREFKYSLRDLDQADLDVLAALAGTSCLFRDHLGRKMFCTFFTYEISERRTFGLYDVSTTLIEISYDESAAYGVGS